MDGRGTIGGGAWREGDIRMMAIDRDAALPPLPLRFSRADREIVRAASDRLRPTNAIERRHLREARELMLGGALLVLEEGDGWRFLAVGGHEVLHYRVPTPGLDGWGCTCPRYSNHSCVHEWVLSLVEEVSRMVAESGPLVA